MVDDMNANTKTIRIVVDGSDCSVAYPRLFNGGWIDYAEVFSSAERATVEAARIAARFERGGHNVVVVAK